MTKTKLTRSLAYLLALILLLSALPLQALAANPFLPLWERVPDGEPRVFEDPDNPGEYRLYLYGSHDSRVSGYCGPDHVVWSAPVDDPNNWRCEGEVFHVDQLNGIDFVDSDGKTKQLTVDVEPIEAFVDEFGVNHRGSTAKNTRVMLYAPDVVYHPENDKYYMYLFVDGMWHVNANSAGTPSQRRHPMFVAESDSPAGPFTNPKFVTLAFDPAVLVDDVKNEDGKSKVYLYWTPEENRNLMACELDPDDMCTILPGTTHYPLGNEDQAPNNTLPDWDAPFYMFEGSSVRKVDDTYLMMYCRGVREAQTATNNISEIGWAYSDNPFGDPEVGLPWTFGGVIVSNKGEEVTNPYTGEKTFTFNGGNVHGGAIEVNGQWYQVYHRNSNVNGKRQAMVEAFDLNFVDGKPVIEQVEMTSQGFELEGLDPYTQQYAGIACYTIPANGPQFFSQVDAEANYDPDAERDDWYPAQRIKHQNWLGYKYFNFGEGIGARNGLKLRLDLKALVDGTTINIYAANAKEKFSDPEQEKTLIGSVLVEKASEEVQSLEAVIENTDILTGKQGIYLEFLNTEAKPEPVPEGSNEPAENPNLVELNTFQFILEKHADTCPSEKFTDFDANAYYHDALDFMVENQYILGTTDSTFAPSASLSRGMATTILWRAMGSPEAKAASSFTDVDATVYYAKAIDWAVEAGLVEGFGDGTFRPDAALTREQLVTILYRHAGKPAATGSLSSYPDADAVQAYAKDAFLWATTEGYVNGLSTQGKITLSPGATATRAQASTLIWRYLQADTQ